MRAQVEVKLAIEQWIKELHIELSEMDRVIPYEQLKLWEHFGDHPGFPQAGLDVFQGWAEQNYLDWKVVEFKFNLKPATGSFWKRFIRSINWIFRRSQVIRLQDIEYVIVGASTPNSIAVMARFEKANGEITSNYELKQ